MIDREFDIQAVETPLADWTDSPRPSRHYTLTIVANPEVDPQMVLNAFERNTPAGAAILALKVAGYRHPDGQVRPYLPPPEGFTVYNNEVIVERGTQTKLDFYIARAKVIPGTGALYLPLDATVYHNGRCVGYNSLRRLPATSRVWRDDNWITIEDFLSRINY